MNNFRLAPGLRNLLILLAFSGTLSSCGKSKTLVIEGTPGESCTVESVVGGVLLTCGPTMAVVYNGLPGQDGAPGERGPEGQPGQNATPTPYTVTQIVDPCGPGPGFNEVLLQMQNGQILAYFEQGSNRFLSLLAPGIYRTTDAQKCTFQVGPAPGFAISW